MVPSWKTRWYDWPMTDGTRRLGHSVTWSKPWYHIIYGEPLLLLIVWVLPGALRCFWVSQEGTHSLGGVMEAQHDALQCRGRLCSGTSWKGPNRDKQLPQLVYKGSPHCCTFPRLNISPDFHCQRPWGSSEVPSSSSSCSWVDKSVAWHYIESTLLHYRHHNSTSCHSISLSVLEDLSLYSMIILSLAYWW